MRLLRLRCHTPYAGYLMLDFTLMLICRYYAIHYSPLLLPLPLPMPFAMIIAIDEFDAYDEPAAAADALLLSLRITPFAAAIYFADASPPHMLLLMRRRHFTLPSFAMPLCHYVIYAIVYLF